MIQNVSTEGRPCSAPPLLRTGRTVRSACAQAITLLDRLTEQGLTDLQNAAPHHFIAHTADGVTEHWEQPVDAPAQHRTAGSAHALHGAGQRTAPDAGPVHPPPGADGIEADGHAVVGEGTVVDVLLDEPGRVRLPNKRARALSWGLKARVLDEKYKIERLTAAEKAAYEQSITFDVPDDDNG
ncbi:hypothetical protein ACFWZ6_27985 [Streptomyces massasporeus]